MLQLLITGETIMKINTLDYVRTEAFTVDELKELESLVLSQGYNLTDEVNSNYVENWLEYGVDDDGFAIFWGRKFSQVWEGNDITDQFRNYLDNDKGVVAEEESSKNKPFTKDNLKDGMVVNFRDTDFKEGVVFRERIFATDKSPYSRISSGGITQLEELLDNLKHDSYPEYDIMKVSYMDEVLWERVEETPEQKRIKELEKIISDAQKELESLSEE
ncbi:hypothetical protein HWD03_gp090 [Alteromonas phage vB_AmeM_PT11-V22]|uniref:Uncharacterized protein n=1 Tax=Alteromonas phage vB_AmeM_PT11-V22 TaxID=2704031 RepID=A0A6C0R0I2_9CAUD|nr:hypothetical protein HWD03_gp090 [Alteromonas phage vB_AmeM_PT11-V22]QHZ59771.1 hypothetical protein [Alteromonas phage vB_AmeM_PT11-V22]